MEFVGFCGGKDHLRRRSSLPPPPPFSLAGVSRATAMGKDTFALHLWGRGPISEFDVNSVGRTAEDVGPYKICCPFCRTEALEI